MTDKHCPSCKQTKPLDDFYRNLGRPDGHGAYCKQCHRAQATVLRKKYRRRHAKYFASPNGKAAFAKYQQKNQTKRKCQSAVTVALKTGKLIRATVCENCGRPEKLDAHHDDYAEPMDVRWLCRWCHKAWHRKHGEAPNAPAITGTTD